MHPELRVVGKEDCRLQVLDFTLTMYFLRGLALVVFLVSSSVGSFGAAPNIILITLDTTRADRMGFLGSKRGLTPNLDALARQSVVFARAYAQVPLTTPSHATILTGTYPQFNQIGDMGNVLGESLPYLPDILHGNGYSTAGFVGSQVLDPAGVGAPGFGRGFDIYDAGFHSRSSGEDRYQSIERRALSVVERAQNWILKHSTRPFFLWVHLYDPHDPYDPPLPFKTRYATQLYDGEIAYTDFAVGKLLQLLRSRGLYRGSLIAVMADHGEALGEHGEASHGIFLYDETIHVPLMFKLPGQQQGARIQSRVGLVDVAPTVLALAGTEVPRAMQGVVLLGAAARENDRPAYAESDYPFRAFGWSPLRSVRNGKYLYIKAPRPELYDESADPKATRNIASSERAVAETMSAGLRQFVQKTRSASTAKQELRPEQVEQLQALGYVATVNRSDPAGAEGGADPKDKIEIANAMHEALLAAEEDRYQDAVSPLQRVLKGEPTSALANLQLGKALSRLQQYEQALPYLKKAVALTPESGLAQYELGVALMGNADFAEGARQLELAVLRVPDSADIHFSLASAYEKMGRDSDAAKEYKTTLQLDARHFLANLMLGRMLGMANHPQDALPYLQTAVKLEPGSADAHRFLANVYTELGQSEDARRERDEAERQQERKH
jgi:choline-sulfatase